MLLFPVRSEFTGEKALEAVDKWKPEDTVEGLEKRIAELEAEQEADKSGTFRQQPLRDSPVAQQPDKAPEASFARYTGGSDDPTGLFSRNRAFWEKTTNDSAGPEFAFDLVFLLLGQGIAPSYADLEAIVLGAEAAQSFEVAYKLAWRLAQHRQVLEEAGTGPEELARLYSRIITGQLPKQGLPSAREGRPVNRISCFFLRSPARQPAAVAGPAGDRVHAGGRARARGADAGADQQGTGGGGLVDACGGLPAGRGTGHGGGV